MNEFHWIAVAAVVVLSSARLTRLLTFDKFPPVAWARNKYANATDGSDWQLLVFCNYCMSVWTTAFVVLTGDLAGLYDGKPVAPWVTPLWWFVNGILAASYLAATYTTHDGEEA